jgi:hypothetical protein
LAADNHVAIAGEEGRVHDTAACDGLSMNGLPAAGRDDASR